MSIFDQIGQALGTVFGKQVPITGINGPITLPSPTDIGTGIGSVFGSIHIPSPTDIGTAVGSGVSAGVQQTIDAVNTDIVSIETLIAHELKTAAIWTILGLILLIGVLGLVLPSGDNEFPIVVPA